MLKSNLVLSSLCLLVTRASLILSNSEVMASTASKQVVSKGNGGVTFEVDYAPYHYKWKEPGLKEEDMMHRIDIGIRFCSGKLSLRPELSIFGGQVEYDGRTWDGTPAETDTTYSGHRVELKAGYTFQLGAEFMMPLYVSLGLEKWKRALDATTLDEEPVIGYTEKWRSFYGKLGIAPIKGLGNYYIYGDAYVKAPFKIRNKVELFDVEVKPKSKLGYGVEIGFGVKDSLKKGLNLEMGVFYEYDKFGKSSAEAGNVFGIPELLYQPESKREILGVKLGVKF